MYIFDFRSFAERYLIPDAVPLPVSAQFRTALAGFLALTGTFFLADWLVPGGPATPTKGCIISLSWMSASGYAVW